MLGYPLEIESLKGLKGLKQVEVQVLEKLRTHDDPEQRKLWLQEHQLQEIADLSASDESVVAVFDGFFFY